MQADLSLFKKHRCSFYVYGPIKLVMLVLGVVGSGCVHTDMLPMLFENGTLAKFSVIELRSYNYAFMAQEADSLIQCNIRHFLPMIMDDFTHLSKYVDIVYYKAHVLELIGTNDLHQKE